MRKERVETGCVIDRIAKLIKLERGVDARESRSIRCNVSSHKRANLGWPVIGLEYLNRIDDIRTLIREAIEVAKGLNNEKRPVMGWFNGRKPQIQLLDGTTNWPAVVQAFEDVGYRGYLTFEYFHPYLHYPEALIYQTGDSLDRMLGNPIARRA